jgi:hypothetical protein
MASKYLKQMKRAGETTENPPSASKEEGSVYLEERAQHALHTAASTRKTTAANKSKRIDAQRRTHLVHSGGVTALKNATLGS